MKKIFTLFLLFCCARSFALDPNDFTIQRISSPYFVVDANSATTGPLKAYVGFRITNTSLTVSYSNLKFTINSISTNTTGQNYSLVSPASGITVVGTLAPGESKVCYYYVAYPANTIPQGTFNYTLSDATPSTKTGASMIYNRSAISANAGGLATQSINNQDLIGGVVYDDVTYTLGNIRNGDEADFQISVSTQFDPTKLTLLKTEVTSSTVTGVAAGTVDKLYYTTTANQSSGTVTIRWTFKISSYNFSTLVLPYAGATSGASNYKYAISTDLGSGTPITISASANPLIITKTSDQVTYGTGNNALFTVTIQNPGAYGISIDKITDQVPAGFTYQSLDGSSNVTTANSTAVPSAGATGTITFEGGVTSGINTSYTVPAGGSIVLKYIATAPPSQASNLQTTARGYIGTTEFGTAQNTVNVSSTLPSTLLSFTGTWVNAQAKLDWSTGSEANSDHFEVERSTGNGQFIKIGEVQAAGYSSSLLSYSFTDVSPEAGLNQYRLRMVDQDGLFKYSAVIVLQYNTAELTIQKLYPNPFVQDLQLNISANKQQTIQIILLDGFGRRAGQQSVTVNKGMNYIPVRGLGALPAGIYMVQVISDRKILSEKILKHN